MKRREMPAVPPLSESAVARIERGVFAELDRPLPIAPPPRRRVRWWMGLVLATTAAAGAAALVVGWQRQRGDGDGDGVGAGAGAHIATAAAGTHVTLNGASVDVAPHSEIRFGVEGDRGVAIVLERGAVTCEVAPRTHRAPFVVEAGETRVTVIGTKFRVQRIGGHASVVVDHGTVEVDDDGMTQILHAGDRYEPADGRGRHEITSATTERGSDDVPRAAAAAPVVAAPVAPVATRPSASVRRTDDASGTRASASGPHPRALALRGAPAPASSSAPVRSVVAPTVATPDPQPAEQPTPTAALPAIAVPTPDADQALARQFETAARLEALNPVEAMRVYAEIAGADGPWAANALFAQGRLEAERGHTSPARALLTAYLRRFPQGRNVADAHLLLERLPPR